MSGSDPASEQPATGPLDKQVKSSTNARFHSSVANMPKKKIVCKEIHVCLVKTGQVGHQGVDEIRVFSIYILAILIPIINHSRGKYWFSCKISGLLY